ncbi:hypothetical protein PGT21_000497 [Puccinia graminis f. sp. tritici]|uniref:Uncharacterized protein n=1 Tax=Puccinia graminis f. sp. tritici TaxID=56615 RepID=A0A5B0NSD9_PUCGR|nr:hypothetical protein PGT21_000497 [Puccinia graminis f. sp. tritici]
MVALMEPDNLEGDESTERMSVTNCSYARQIEEAQNAISPTCMEQCAWVEGTSVIYYKNCKFLTNISDVRSNQNPWLENQTRAQITMSTFNNQQAIDTQAPWITS